MRFAKVLGLGALLAVGLSLSSPPRAQATAISPFPTDGVEVFIGTVDFFGLLLAGVCFKAPDPAIDPAWSWFSWGHLTSNQTVWLNDGDEVVRMATPTNAVAGCGTNFTALVHNFYKLEILMEGGDDQFRGGSGGPTDVRGGPGVDRAMVYASNVRVFGGDGNDRMWNQAPTSAVATFYGEGDNDCIAASAADIVYCGSGSGDVTTSYKGSGCETKNAPRCWW